MQILDICSGTGAKKPFDLLTKRRLTSKSFAVKLFEMLQAKQAGRHTASQTQPIPAAATVYLKLCHVHPGRHMVFAEYEVECCTAAAVVWLPNGVIYNEEHSHYCRTSQKLQWPGLYIVSGQTQSISYYIYWEREVSNLWMKSILMI